MAIKQVVICDNCDKSVTVADAKSGIEYEQQSSVIPPNGWRILTVKSDSFPREPARVFCCPRCLIEWQQKSISDPRHIG